MQAELAFVQPNVSLIPRSCTVSEGLSRPFEVLVTAWSSAADLDLARVAGHGAAFRLASGDSERPFAVWSGLCSDIEQIAVEPDGMSLYALSIVPMLWRTTQRRNYRIYQHLSNVEVVRSLLEEWGIATELRLGKRKQPEHEYRVQFAETDFAFVNRLLEEAGVSYGFEQVDARGEDRELESMKLWLSDEPARTGARFGEAASYVGHVEGHVPHGYVSKVTFGRAVRPGRFSLGGYDYRSSPDLRLLAEAGIRDDLERRYELYDYLPGAFLDQPSKDRGAAASEAVGNDAATVLLEEARSAHRRVGMTTNVVSLAPGGVFRMSGHPRADLCAESGLLVTGRRIVAAFGEGTTLEGLIGGKSTITLEAVPTVDPFRPQRVTPRPRVMGVESAIVVGPPGEEIHTDGLGRVRVQFHWDRYGKRDEQSSCWMRVSQAWAGSGYGVSAVPRVGHEVLVDFFEGDPDQPIIVGRVYNKGAIPPDRLPQDQTKTTWRSHSTPGSDGYNEISMRDAAGEELVHLRAERNLDKLVRFDETASIGHDLVTTVANDEKRDVAHNQSIHVAGDRSVDVDGSYGTRADGGLQTQAGNNSGIRCEQGRLIITNGSASIVLDGPNLHFDAAANLRLSAGGVLGLYGAQVKIDGTPEVFINCGQAGPPRVEPLPGSARGDRRDGEEAGRGRRERTGRGGSGRPRRPEGMREADFRMLPDGINDQLGRYRLAVGRGRAMRSRLLDEGAWDRVRERAEDRLDRETLRLKRLGRDFNRIFDSQRNDIVSLSKGLKSRLTLERSMLGDFRGEVGAVFAGERGNFLQSSKALIVAVRDQTQRIFALRRDLHAILDRETGLLAQYRNEWKAYYDDVKGTVEDFRNLIDNPEDAVVDILLGDESDAGSGAGRGTGADGGGGRGDGGRGDGGRGDGGRGEGDRGGRGEGRDEGRGGRDEGRGGREGRGDEGGREGRGDEGGREGRGDEGGREGRGDEGGREGRGDRGRHKETSSHGSSRQPVDGGARAEAPRAAPDAPSHGTGSQGTGSQGSGARQPATVARSAGVETAVAQAPAGAAGAGSAGAGVAGGVATSATAGTAAGTTAATVSSDDKSGTVLTRDGGLTSSDVASSVGTDGPSYLQTPAQGQLMVVPSEGAQPLDEARIRAAMVEAQMDGKPVTPAIARSLEEQGYTTYQRGWDDWWGALKRLVGGENTA
jgi:type VI secretion system secreted protein VgrG